jgi:excisionase family DNA binding protein
MATIVLTLEEVAQFLRVHPSTVYRLLRKRTIPAFKVGSDWRFNQESVERWVKKLEITEGG